ncbi:MAG: carboxypeptidase-like regulatory domain-containing protein [Thermoanaerobaculia bacterium]
MHRPLRALASSLILWAASTLPLAAQEWRGPVAVEVTAEDSRGRNLGGAEVRLIYLDPAGGGALPSVLTDENGRANIAGLAAGRWTVEVRQHGFMTYRAEVSLSADRKPVVESASQEMAPGATSTMRVKLQRGRGGAPPPARAPVAEAPPVRSAPPPAPEPAKPAAPAAPAPIPKPQAPEPALQSAPVPPQPAPAPAAAPSIPPVAAPQPAPVPAEKPSAAVAKPEPAPPAPAPAVVRDQPVSPPPAAAPVPPAPEPRPAVAPIPPVAPVVVEPAPAAPPAPVAPAAPESAPPAEPAPSPLTPSAATPAPRQRLCVECPPGESAAWGEATIEGGAKGGCPADLAARLRGESLDGLAESSEIGPGCRVIRVDLPAGARYTGFRFEARSAGVTADCLPGRECPAGNARFPFEPVLRETGNRTTLLVAFESDAPDRRSALVAGYSTYEKRKKR